MKAWVYRKQKMDSNGIHIFLEDVLNPGPEPNQVILRIEKVSVCGTDEALFKGELKRVPDGIVPGHEFYGEIVELGKEVKTLRAGQKIAGESHYSVEGATEQGIIGLWGPEIRKGESLPPLNGGYAQYICIPQECAHPVPAELVAEGFWPSIFEAIGNDYFLIKKVIQMQPFHYLGIFGCGPHGLFAQIFARHFGISRIVAFETDDYRRNFASQAGVADAVFDPREKLLEKVSDFTSGKFFDVTLDMVGKQGQAFEACCETTRDGGTIFLFGLFTDRFAINGIPGNEIIFKMRTLTYQYKGKKLQIAGITGREGIWTELIQTVCASKDLQHHLMRPVHVLGTLDRLGEDTHNLQPSIMKRAYYAFL